MLSFLAIKFFLIESNEIIINIINSALQFYLNCKLRARAFVGGANFFQMLTAKEGNQPDKYVYKSSLDYTITRSYLLVFFQLSIFRPNKAFFMKS